MRSNIARVSWFALRGALDINTQKGFYWSDSLEYLADQYDKIPAKYRDPRIVEALAEVADQPPSRQHLIEFFITLYRAGFNGVEISQDLLCAAISRCTHAHRFGVRTLRDSLRWAEHANYITSSWLPIGLRAVTNSGEYTTKKIRRHDCTYKMRLLVSILRIDPDQYQSATPVLEIVDRENLHDPTPAIFADNPNGELPQGPISGPCGKLSRQDNDQVRTNAPDKTVHSENEDKTTQPALNGRTIEHSPSKPVGSRRRKRPQKKTVPFSRVKVAKSPVTYARARKNFLHELFVALKPGSLSADRNGETLYRCAEFLTDPDYPLFLPQILDWFDYLTTTYFADWHQRRRDIEHIAVPALRAFLADWTPPEIERDNQGSITERSSRAVDDWERSLAPQPGIAVNPRDLPRYFKLWPYVRANISAWISDRTKFDSTVCYDRHGAIYQFCKLFF